MPAIGVRSPSRPAETPHQVPREEDLRLSQRVLLHLAREPVVEEGRAAPRGMTQAGMVVTLGVPQGALTNVLRRLVAGKMLTDAREHAEGFGRRVKVYRLTPTGERIARSLRGQSGPAVSRVSTNERSGERSNLAREQSLSGGG